ncbi:MAG: protein kinase [Myxococcales bacterium]|jgi:tRNA A-37 threonylcarbamoyl transferase component Bud32|nr:protein kinase [Myxococcales bacterium]
MSQTASSRYELIDKIAKGGMAEVYRGRKVGTRGYNALVAIKRILPERAEDPNFVEMLIDEARITSQLKHPNIAQLHELACDDSGYFIVMELLLGPNFAALIDKLKLQGRHLPQACAIEVIIELLKALDYAHGKRDASGRPLNLVHRDISPDNLLLGPNGEVKLIDFGVAKAKDRLSDKTKAGMIKGKFSYLAPERLRSSLCDGRVDLFSAALVLWEALAGRIRYDATDDRMLIEQIEANEAPSFREMGIELAPQLEAILDRALRTRPDERYQTAAAFRDALEGYQRRFNPGDNIARLGKLVASSFKEELRWLEDARLKFQEGRLAPLRVIGGGILEERFQLTKRRSTATNHEHPRALLAAALEPTPLSGSDVFLLPDADSAVFDSQVRAETNIFANQGIALLEQEAKQWQRGDRSPFPMLAQSNIPKTEISPPPTMDDDTVSKGSRLPLSTSEDEKKTKTRTFEFGKGRRWAIQIDLSSLLILAGAILSGFLVFACLIHFLGNPEATELPPAPLPAPTASATTRTPKKAMGAASSPQAALPSSPESSAIASATSKSVAPSTAPSSPSPLAEPPPPAPAKPSISPPQPAAMARQASAPKSAPKAPPKASKRPQRKAPARSAIDTAFDATERRHGGSRLSNDDDFSEPDDFSDAPRTAPPRERSAKSAADEAFGDF